MIGTTISHYRITDKLGQGGMGEVFLAHDTYLDRKVALKFLPDIFSDDPERLARFEREAKLLASLNHPNIATIYGLEQADGTRFLAMELVEGETLAQQIERGPLAVDEALIIGRQIAEGLEAAHARGVVHRDLKPANVKITPEGKAKILDFGLAKAFQDETPAVDASKSPTLTDKMTRAGVILGTAAYMSPEQARGKVVDKRADIWAFGCVLYEMLTGRSAFRGEDVSEILASVIKDDPRLNLLPANIHPRVTEILSRCLQKDLGRRYRDIGDVQFELDQALAAPTCVGAASPKKHNPWHERALWITVIMCLAVLLSFLSYRTIPPLGMPPMQFEIGHPITGSGSQIAISPDGRYLTSVTGISKDLILWVRPLRQAEGQIMKGTEGGQDPFWSPDGRFIGFVSDGKLKKIDIFGGPAEVLSNAAANGGSWNKNGTILFTREDEGPIFRISASGTGTPVPVTELDKSREEIAHVRPFFLPDDKRFLFLALSKRSENNAIVLASLDSKAKKLLVPSLVAAAFSPPHHLLFMRDDTLLAQEVDPESFDRISEPMPIAQSVGNLPSRARAGFSVSKNGVLAYRHMMGVRKLLWFSRSDSSSPQVQSENPYANPTISPDGQRLAGYRRAPNTMEQSDIWTQDIISKTESRFTSDEKDDTTPVWSPDGRQILFGSNRDGGRMNLYVKSAGGAGTEELLLKTDFDKVPTDWSIDGRYIVYQELDPRTRWNLWLLPQFGDRKPVPYLQAEFNETSGRLSPDSRWMAYVSNETGASEVYIQTVPTSTNKWKITNSGGRTPRWRHNGNELFYVRALELMGLDVRERNWPNKFDFGPPQRMFLASINSYDVSADGQRFLVDGSEVGEHRSSLTVVTNWVEALLSKR